MTNPVVRNTVIPYWNEIKMRWEDRSNLAKFIELSLQEEKDVDGDLQSFIGNLDETAMKVAANFAYEETIAQKKIPYSEILNVVKEELE